MAKACIVDGNRAEYVRRVGLRLNKFLKDNPDVNKTSLLRMVYSDILTTKGEAFAEVVNSAIENIIGGKLAYSYFHNDNISLPSLAQRSKIKGSGSNMIDAVSDEISEGNNMHNDDDTITDEDIVTNNSDKSIGDSGIGDFDQNFFSAIGERLYSADIKSVYIQAKKADTFDKFYNWVDTKWNIADKKDSALRIRDLRKFYTANNSINSIKVEDKFELQYINFDDSKPIENYSEDIASNIIEHPKFISKIPYNLKDDRDESEYSAKSFVDELTVDEANVRGIKLSRITGYFHLNRSGILKYVPYGNNWKFEELSAGNISSESVNTMEYGLSNFVNSKGQAAPYVMVGMTPGDTGSIVISRVQGAHVNELFPKDQIAEALRASAMETRAAQVDALDISIATWFKNIESKAKKSNDKRLFSEYLAVKKAVESVGISNWEAYLKTQAPNNMTEAQMKLQMEAANKPAFDRNGEWPVSFPIHLSSLLAKHEWLQAVRGSDYMKAQDGNIYHLNTRLKLPLSKGLATEGTGENIHVIYKASDVDYYYNGEKIDNIQDIPGIGNTNIVDGASFASKRYIQEQSENVGSYVVKPGEFESKEIKSVYSEVSLEDGKSSYIEKKHAVFEAPVGLEVWRKGTYGRKNSNPLVKVEQDRIVDQEGNSIDEFSDDDAVKTATGKFANNLKTGQSFSLKEKSRRLIKTPKNKANDTVYGPVQFLSALNYSLDKMDKGLRTQFEKYQQAFTDMMLEQSNIYNKAFMDASNDPNVLRRLVKFIYSQKGEKKDALRNKLTVTGGIGIHHPDNWTILRDFVLNMLLGRGSMQSRSYHSKISPSAKNGISGSNYVLKPDIKGEIPNNDSVILSADNKAIYNKIKEISGRNTVAGVNGWLESESEKGNNYKVITYRSPILHISAIEMRNILRFEENGGNTIIHHPEDVFRRLIGDHDIDEAGVMLVPDKYVDTFQEFHNSDFYKRQLVNPSLDMFVKKSASDVNLADIDAFRESIVDMSRGLNIQGTATNTKSVMSTLSMRFDNIEFSDGVIVKPKGLNDSVVMDYAPLDMSTKDQWEDSLPEGASIVKGKDGNSYLKTTVSHEALLIVNAATDHTNKKLKGMISNVWGMQDPTWFTKRMFDVKKGNLTDMHINLLSQLKKQYNYSSVKRLRDSETRNKYSLGKAMGVLDGISRLLRGDLIDHKTKLMSDIVYEKPMKDQLGSEVVLSFKDLEMKNVITPEEQIIISMTDMIDKNYEDSYPFGYPPERYEMSHFIAREQLWDGLEGYSTEDLKNGYNFALKFTNAFYGLAKDRKQMTDSEVKIKRAEYDEDMFNLVKKYLPEFNRLSDNAKKIHTISVISGMDFRKNIKYLPPVEILSESVYKDYMTKWEDAFFKEQDGVPVSMMFENSPDMLRSMRRRKLPIAQRIQQERC